MPYKTFQIDGIGDVIITKHARSKNIRIRIIGSRVKVSIPRWVPYKYALKYTEQKKPWIKANIKQKSFFYSGAKIGKHHELQLIKSTKEKLWSQINENKVYVLPKHLDEKVARLHLAKIGVELDVLTNEQASYLGISKEGPYKSEMYRY